MNETFDLIIEKMHELFPDMKEEIENTRAIVVNKEKSKREKLIERCHPNGVELPPHHDCPACQKIIMEKYFMYKLKENISWEEVNVIFDSIFSVLDEESRNKFNNDLQYARENCEEPKKFVETIVSIFFVEKKSIEKV